MLRSEKPKLRLKFELEVPNLEGAPSKKFMVSRTLKARWGDDPQLITQQILDEIKNYKGSYVGDTIRSLHSVCNSKENLVQEETTRSNDVAKWLSQVIDSMIFSGIEDEICEVFIDNQTIPEWDGTLRNVGPISSEEVKDADLEKVMLLLTPKIKHTLLLLSKKIQKQSEQT